MPRLLSSLTADEQHLYADLAKDPLDAATPHILADAAEDQGEHQRAAQLRDQSRLALLELLRGQALTDHESAQVAGRLEGLQSPPQAKLERELAAALGPPQRGDAMLHLLDPDGALDEQRLQEQYEFQRTLLASLDLLETQGGQVGITGVDDKFHPLPSLDTIQARLQEPALRQKVAHGFNQLLLVPFALPLPRLLNAWRQDLLRNEHLLQPHGGLNRQQPVWTHDELRDGQGLDQDGRLVYTPQRFAADHGGRTKAQLLSEDPNAGWQVLLTEGALRELPLAGQGQTIAGRRQIEAGRTPELYLADFPEGEVGWTPEAYIAAFCTTLERSGQVLDRETVSILVSSYLPDSGDVPCAYWWLKGRLLNLTSRVPDMGYPHSGTRAAVQVL